MLFAFISVFFCCIIKNDFYDVVHSDFSGSACKLVTKDYDIGRHIRGLLREKNILVQNLI